MKKRVGIYRIISIVVLGLCMYALLLPVISPLMSRLLPGVWTCPFLRITGHPCPFCGITRGISNIYTLETGSASIISMVAFMLILLETAFRIIIVLSAAYFKEKAFRRIVWSDIVIHTILTVLLCIYVIMFLVNTF